MKATSLIFYGPLPLTIFTFKYLLYSVYCPQVYKHLLSILHSVMLKQYTVTKTKVNSEINKGVLCSVCTVCVVYCIRWSLQYLDITPKANLYLGKILVNPLKKGSVSQDFRPPVFFHDSDPSRPLIKRLKYFRIRFRFRRDIRSQS